MSYCTCIKGGKLCDGCMDCYKEGPEEDPEEEAVEELEEEDDDDEENCIRKP